MRIGLRHKALAILVGAVLLGLLYYMFVLAPALSRERRLLSIIDQRQMDIQEMMVEQRGWDQFNEARYRSEQALAKRGAGFTLLSFLEGVARAVGVQEQIRFMKPLTLGDAGGGGSLEGIEMELDRLGVRQLVDLLYRIEYADKLLKIRRLKIDRTGSGRQRSLRVNMQVITIANITSTRAENPTSEAERPAAGQ
jgi:hypothetical protein